MRKTGAISMTELADKMAGVEGVKWKDRTPEQRRMAWKAQKDLSVPGGGYARIPDRAVTAIAALADEARSLRAELEDLRLKLSTCRAFNDMYGDGEMKLGVTKAGW